MTIFSKVIVIDTEQRNGLPRVECEKLINLSQGMWTTADLLKAEQQVITFGDQLYAPSCDEIDVEALTAFLKRYTLTLPDYYEKEERLRTLTRLLSGKQRIKLLLGSPGSSKTKIAIAAFQGFQELYGADTPMLALAMTETAAGKLGGNAGAQSLTVDAFLEAKDQGRALDGGIVAVDEACLIDTPRMAKLLKLLSISHLRKLILIGDARQEVPEGPGNPTVLLRDRYRGDLETVIQLDAGFARQRFETDRLVLSHFYNARPREAVRLLQAEERIRWVYPKAGRETLLQKIGKSYALWRQAHEVYSKQDLDHGRISSGPMVLTVDGENREIDNQLLREIQVKRGVITKSIRVKNINKQEVEIGIGERLLLSQAVKDQQGRTIPAGTLVSIIGMEKGQFIGLCDLKAMPRPRLTLKLKVFPAVRYAYALSLQEAQGLAIDAAFILIDRQVTGHQMVSLFSRHRYHARLYVDRTLYANAQKLAQALAIFPHKANISDYAKDILTLSGLE